MDLRQLLDLIQHLSNFEMNLRNVSEMIYYIHFYYDSAKPCDLKKKYPTLKNVSTQLINKVAAIPAWLFSRPDDG